MATISFGSVPGAPGTYINETVGNVATAAIASFSTVYMLVEAEESVSVVNFPFNVPIPVTSLADYRALVGGFVPESRIPLLSYNCVNEFFQNAQIGDLRVVRVGTPNQIVEIEILASGTKISNNGIPSQLEAGDVVYAQLILNGLKLVAGNGSTGYTSSGDWLGVPVTIPVDYIDGDVVNNRKISKAIATAIAAAIESNPSVRSSIYVRDYGLEVDVNSTSNSESGYVSVAATTYGGSVSVVSQQNPVGSKSMLMNNTYDIQPTVGLEVEPVRVPQDYVQCINTAFDGQQNQGYLIAPTAYAQFDAEGRASVGAAAAAHCQSENFKWLALADPGPYLVTDVNKYKGYTPHMPAEDLITGMKYLVDNAIYEWTGVSVTYDKLQYQAIVGGYNPKVAVQQSVEPVAVDEKVGAIDPATFTISSLATKADIGKFVISSSAIWPAEFQIMEVNTSNLGLDFVGLPEQVFVVAPPFNSGLYGPYPSNGTVQIVYLALTATKASSVYNEVMSAGGSSNMLTLPADAFYVSSPTGSTADITYTTSAWDLYSQITIKGQKSNLIQNITDSNQYVNTVHLPGTLQDSTQEYRLNFVSRTFFDPGNAVSSHSLNGSNYCKFECVNHNLQNGQQLFFTQKLLSNTSVVFKATTVNGTNPYYVKVVDNDHFLLASSYSNYLAEAYVVYPTAGVTTATPTIVYTKMLGGKLTALNLAELSTVALIRGRKYGFDSGNIFSVAASEDESITEGIDVSIYMNNSSVVLGEEQVFPYGETAQAGWLPKLDLVQYGPPSTAGTTNFVCTPVVNQRFGTDAYLVPSIESIYGGQYYAGVSAALSTIDNVTDYVSAVGLSNSDTGEDVQNLVELLDGVYFDVLGSGKAPDDSQDVTDGDRIAVVYDGSDYNWVVVKPTGSNTILALDSGSLAGGSGYADGTYTDIPLISSFTGEDAKATIEVFSGSVIIVILTNGGIGYQAGETLTVDDSLIGGGAGFLIDVATVVSGDGDMSAVAHVCYGAQVELSLTPEVTPPNDLWRFDAITSTEIIDEALRGVGFNGEPQAVFIEAGVDNVNRLLEDSQRYFNAFGFIAYYGPYIENASNQFIPPSPYVTGVAIRRYRAEGFQFPPAGVKYQLIDAISSQIPINSAQQNLLNPEGCNAIRTLPGYPDNAVFIWGGRTRINNKVADQLKFQFVNTRVIQNVVYGSLRNAFDNQIFSIIDGFGIVFNQITTIGTSVLSQLWIAGALYGSRPADAFQVICDERINKPENLENGLVYVKVFDVPVPTLEKIEVDLIRVSIGQMNNEIQSQGLG